MKLISRKAMVAVAATTALTFSGLTAPAFAEEDGSSKGPSSSFSTPFEGSSGKATPEQKTDKAGEDAGDDNNDEADMSSGSSEDIAPKDIKDWIGVFTAVIGALSAAFVFAQRLANN